MAISSKTKRLLLARSGGYCQNPECNTDLYPYYENRSDLKPLIQKLLEENNIIFTQYGPQSDFAKNSPQSEASRMWELKSIDTLIPNNRIIYELLSKNYSLKI